MCYLYYKFITMHDKAKRPVQSPPAPDQDAAAAVAPLPPPLHRRQARLPIAPHSLAGLEFYEIYFTNSYTVIPQYYNIYDNNITIYWSIFN